MKKIAFIGLGNMGYPMAGHLAQAGFHVSVYNRTHSKAKAWQAEHKGETSPDLKEAVRDADVLLLCVGRDEDVRALLVEQKALDCLAANALVIDHSTTSALLAEEIDQACQNRGLRFADAPVSGGQQGAINGKLSIMLGCASNDFDEIRSLTQAYTAVIERMGAVGAGQKTKMVNQICVAGLLQGLAEGVQFALNAGLDAEKVMQVIGQGAASSWQLNNRHKTMIEGEYEHGFAVDWMRKDLQICLQEALHNGSSLPVTALVDQFYGELQQQGSGKLDTSSLLQRLPLLKRG